MPFRTSCDELRQAINWQAQLPEYVFSNQLICGFLIIASGVLGTRGLLDFLLEAHPRSKQALAILVRLNRHTPDEITFLADTPDAISQTRMQLMHSELDLFASIVVVSNEPSKWIIYEEAGEDFSVLGVFDDELWEHWSTASNEIHDYTIGEDRLMADLDNDAPPTWKPEFLVAFLKAYGSAETKSRLSIAQNDPHPT